MTFWGREIPTDIDTLEPAFPSSRGGNAAGTALSRSDAVDAGMQRGMVRERRNRGYWCQKRCWHRDCRCLGVSSMLIQEMLDWGRLARSCGAVVALFILSGCVESYPYRNQGTFAGNGGASADLVFSSPRRPKADLDSLEMRQLAAAAESRRDAALGDLRLEREGEGMWPERPRPSLERAGRVYIGGSSNDLLYFRRTRSSEYRAWPDGR